MAKLKFFLISIFIISGLAIYGYFQAIPDVDNQTENRPKIEIEPKSFDFGEINYGEVAEYAFLLKNSGNEILEIKRVATSCACTTAKTEKELLNPGEETNLSVRYDTGAMSGPHGKGEQERIIYVKSNDPLNPQVEVTIQANVVSK